MSTSSVETRRQQPVVTQHVGQLAIWITVTALLFGFIVVVVREIAATIDGDVTTITNDEYILFATSLTGLVGGVFAAAVGAVPRVTGRKTAADPDAQRSDPWRSRLAAAYVVSYAVAGIAATVVCIARLGSATPLLQSLAGGFMGASAAAASAFFGLAAEPER